MKLLSLVVLSSFLLSLAVVGAQQTGLPIYSWMDTTATSALTWTLPSVSDPNFAGQACALSTRSNEQNVKYIAYSFSVNFTGVYEIIGQSGLGVQSNQGGDNFDLDVYLYNGTFDATNPCSNYVRELAQQNYPTAGFSGSPRVEDFAYLRQGTTYTLVATGVDNTSQGRFGLSLYAPIATGNNVGGPRWNSLVWYGKNQNPACTPNTANAPFITYRWLQPTTGFYDVVIGFDINYTVPVSVAAALYLGNVTTATLQSSNPCNIVSGGTLMDGISSGNFQGTTMYYNRLMQNAVYTLVVSGASATQLGNYGVQIMPSRMFNLSTTVNYQSPGRPNGLITATSTCPSSGSELLNWVAIPFSAQADISVVTVPPDWNSPNFDSFDSYTYIFSGTNTANPPTPCTGLVGGWDDRVPAINTTAGPYTVVITPYDDGSFNPASGELTLVYIASGATTPVVPIATTSTGSTTAAPTTTTTTTTTGSATTTTGSASTTSSTANVTTTTTSTTSMASATTVSLVLIFVVSFLCVF